MGRAFLSVALFLWVALAGPVVAQRGDDFDALLAQMNGAMQANRMADALTAAEKLEVLVRRRLVTDLPIIGPLVPDLDLTGRASFRREGAGG